MSDHLPEIDKVAGYFQYLFGFGIIIGGAVLGILGYRRSKPAGDIPEVGRVDPRDAEIARLQKEIEARQLKESIELVLKATREAIYYKLDQGFSGLRTDIVAARAHIGAQVEDSKDEIAGKVDAVSKRLDDLERARRTR